MHSLFVVSCIYNLNCKKEKPKCLFARLLAKSISGNTHTIFSKLDIVLYTDYITYYNSPGYPEVQYKQNSSNLKPKVTQSKESVTEQLTPLLLGRKEGCIPHAEMYNYSTRVTALIQHIVNDGPLLVVTNTMLHCLSRVPFFKSISRNNSSSQHLNFQCHADPRQSSIL